MLRLWRIAPDWQDRAALGTWLYRVASNLCIDRLRRRRPLTGEALPELADEAPGALGRLEARDRAAALHAALAALPDRQRLAILLRHFEDRSNPEIAAVLEAQRRGGREPARPRPARAGRPLAAAAPNWGSPMARTDQDPSRCRDDEAELAPSSPPPAARTRRRAPRCSRRSSPTRPRSAPPAPPPPRPHRAAPAPARRPRRLARRDRPRRGRGASASGSASPATSTSTDRAAWTAPVGRRGRRPGRRLLRPRLGGGLSMAEPRPPLAEMGARRLARPEPRRRSAWSPAR